MGFLDKLLGIAPAPRIEPAANLDPLAAPAPEPIMVTAAQRRSAAEHAARFERAVAQCEALVAAGEKDQERLAELRRQYHFYSQLAALEAGEY